MPEWVCPICGFTASGKTVEEIEAEMKKHIESTKDDPVHKKKEEEQKRKEEKGKGLINVDKSGVGT